MASREKVASVPFLSLRSSGMAKSEGRVVYFGQRRNYHAYLYSHRSFNIVFRGHFIRCLVALEFVRSIAICYFRIESTIPSILGNTLMYMYKRLVQIGSMVIRRLKPFFDIITCGDNLVFRRPVSRDTAGDRL